MTFYHTPVSTICTPTHHSFYHLLQVKRGKPWKTHTSVIRRHKSTPGRKPRCAVPLLEEPEMLQEYVCTYCQGHEFEESSGYVVCTSCGTCKESVLLADVTGPSPSSSCAVATYSSGSSGNDTDWMDVAEYNQRAYVRKIILSDTGNISFHVDDYDKALEYVCTSVNVYSYNSIRRTLSRKSCPVYRWRFYIMRIYTQLNGKERVSLSPSIISAVLQIFADFSTHYYNNNQNVDVYRKYTLSTHTLLYYIFTFMGLKKVAACFNFRFNSTSARIIRPFLQYLEKLTHDTIRDRKEGSCH